MARYLDEFSLGDSFESRPYELGLEESLAFARAYDPQPFHTDAQAAERSFFRSLTASGWLTAGITMRLCVDSGLFADTGIIGTGIDELRWLAPVRPGDTLRVRGEVIEKVPWRNGSRGTLRVLLTTSNAAGVVMTQIANLIMPVRPAAT